MILISLCAATRPVGLVCVRLQRETREEWKSKVFVTVMAGVLLVESPPNANHI